MTREQTVKRTSYEMYKATVEECLKDKNLSDTARGGFELDLQILNKLLGEVR